MMTGKAMAHKYQRTAALSDDEGEDEPVTEQMCMYGSSREAAGSAGLAGMLEGASCPAQGSARFSYANKQQKGMRLKAKQWFSSQ